MNIPLLSAILPIATMTIISLEEWMSVPKGRIPSHNVNAEIPPLRRENWAKTDGHPLRCVRGVGEKDPQTRRKPGVNPCIRKNDPKKGRIKRINHMYTTAGSLLKTTKKKVPLFPNVQEHGVISIIMIPIIIIVIP